ncbi:hypothetical protein [Pedosphaera parvula]|nr:hypothetical protein [Pedosphaera parvula]
MKAKYLQSLLFLVSFIVTGCKTYEYQIIEPPNLAQTINKEPVVVHYEPFEYRFTKQAGYLSMRIINPTDDRMTLLDNRSYVVDPRGESHPIRGRVIGPHSHTSMLLPQTPQSFQRVVPNYGFGAWPGFPYPYTPYYGGFYDEFYYGPLVETYQVITPYNWDWKTGRARISLSYDRQGMTFEHDFVIERRVAK